jgi:hypothetical protein
MPCTERYRLEDGTIAERDCYSHGLPAAQPKPPDLSRDAGDAVGFLGKVRNFAKSAVKHVKAGMPMASDAEILRRHDICQGCEFFKDSTCTKCGCPIARARGYISKLSWAGESCPVGKWGPEVPPSG